MGRRAYSITLAVITGSVILAGCACQSSPRAADEPLRLSSTDGAKAFEAAVAVLGEMHFAIDKADPNTGIIRTHPLPAAQFFEVWRSDNVTLSDYLEANLNTLRRTAWLTIAPMGGEVTVDCLVRVQRLNVPSQTVASSATAYRSLSESTVAGQSLRFSTEQQRAMEWRDLGMDPALANRILARIERRVRNAAATPLSKG